MQMVFDTHALVKQLVNKGGFKEARMWQRLYKQVEISRY